MVVVVVVVVMQCRKEEISLLLDLLLEAVAKGVVLKGVVRVCLL